MTSALFDSKTKQTRARFVQALILLRFREGRLSPALAHVCPGKTEVSRNTLVSAT